MQDIKYVYSTFTKEFIKFSKGLIYLLPAVMIYEMFYIMLEKIGGILLSSYDSLYILWGFIIWASRLACLTHFAGLMNILFMREKLTTSDFYYYEVRYFSSLSQVFFILYLIDLFSGRLLSSLPANFYLVLYFIWKIFTAPAYEAVYLGHEPGNRVLTALSEFWKNNIVACLPYIIIALPLSFFYWRLYSNILSIEAAPLALAFLFRSFFMTLFLFSKAVLFRILYFSTPRSRAFHHRAGL